MSGRKRANKEHIQNLIKKKQEEKQALFDSMKRLEVNASSQTSLHFNFGDFDIPEYNPNLILFEDSIYFKKTIQIYTEWASRSKWKVSSAKHREAYLICTIANLLSLPRAGKGEMVRQPLSVRVKSDKLFSEVIRFLRAESYINFLPGYSFAGKKFDTSKIYPTDKFDKTFPPLPDEYEANLHITIPDSELIRKKKDGKHVELTLSDIKLTRGVANKLAKINQINLSHKIVVRSKRSEYPCCTKLCAVYNRNTMRGGRLYAFGLSYQNDVKRNRASIFIDNEPTIELDYSGLHPRMLYAEKGIQFDGDPYDLADVFSEYDQDPKLRTLSKLALLILINAKENKNIAGILANRVWNDDLALGRYFKKTYKASEEGAGIYKQIVEAVLKKHSTICEYFTSDAGRRLQNTDGKMAVWICYFFAKQGIPILPVHDSFIVDEQYEGLLRDTMNTGYEKFNNGFTCPIDQKITTLKKDKIIL